MSHHISPSLQAWKLLLPLPRVHKNSRGKVSYLEQGAPVNVLRVILGTGAQLNEGKHCAENSLFPQTTVTTEIPQKGKAGIMLCKPQSWLDRVHSGT